LVYDNKKKTPKGKGILSRLFKKKEKPEDDSSLIIENKEYKPSKRKMTLNEK